VTYSVDLARDRLSAGERAAGVFAGIGWQLLELIAGDITAFFGFLEDIESFGVGATICIGSSRKGRYSNI